MIKRDARSAMFSIHPSSTSFGKGVLEGSIFHWTIFILLGGYINTANPPFSAPLLTKTPVSTRPPSLSERSCRSSHKWNVARLQHQQYRDESLTHTRPWGPSCFMRFTFQQIHEVNVSVKHGIHDTLVVSKPPSLIGWGTPSFTMILVRGENHLPRSEPPFLKQKVDF